MKKMFFAAAAATAMISSAAFAAVTFDADAGTGFVGKGDVQLAFSQNNAAIQNALIANPQAYTFSYVSETSYDAVCEWDTVTGGKNSKTIHHVATRTRTSAINAAINGSPRKTSGQNQFTGFILSGFGTTTVTGGTIPEVGGICIGDQGDNSNATGQWTFVTESEDNVPGALYVTYNNNTHAL